MASIISAGTTSGTALNMTGDTSGQLQLATNGSTTAVTIDTSQNVGIGTTAPSSYGAKFVVSDGTVNLITSPYGAGSTGYFGTYGSHSLALLTNNTERMRIDSSGNVLVGTTSYSFSTTNYGIALQPNGETFWLANTPGNLIAFNRNNDGLMFKWFRSGSQVGAISVTSTNTTYATSSDYRLKENVQPMVGALDKVAQLKPVTYTWKVNGSDGQGFIAHELQAIIPDCVSGDKDAVDAEGNPVYQGIDTSFLVATLTAAIQEQQTLIVSQSELINSLTARVTALEAK